MRTVEDIEDGEPMDVTCRVVGAIHTPEHGAVEYELHCRDVEGSPVAVSVFGNSAFADYEWTPGAWYAFEDVVGDVFRGTPGLKPSFSTSVSRVERPGRADPGPLPDVPARATTAADVEDGEKVDLTFRVVGIDPVEGSPAIAREVTCLDLADEELTLTEFAGDDYVDADYEPGTWYRIGPVLGDVFRGTPGIKPVEATTVHRVPTPGVPGLADEYGGRAGANVGGPVDARGDDE